MQIPTGLVSISIPPKGERVHISTDSGKVLALTTDGTEIWSLSLKPDAHLANAPKGILLAADGTGTLHRINSEGKILHRHKVWEDSIALTRQRRNVAGLKRDLDSQYYVEPDTLAQAKSILALVRSPNGNPQAKQKSKLDASSTTPKEKSPFIPATRPTPFFTWYTGKKMKQTDCLSKLPGDSKAIRARSPNPSLPHRQSSHHRN